MSTSDHDQAIRLLAMAGKDLRAAAAMLDRPEFDAEVLGFHIQQACEKCLKAWLADLGVEYPRTHDLAFLLDQLALRGQDVASLRDLVVYSAFAVQYRYETFDAGAEEEFDRKEAIDRAQRLFDKVRTSLSIVSEPP